MLGIWTLGSQNIKYFASALESNADQIASIPASVSLPVKWETVEHDSSAYRFWSHGFKYCSNFYTLYILEESHSSQAQLFPSMRSTY